MFVSSVGAVSPAPRLPINTFAASTPVVLPVPPFDIGNVSEIVFAVPELVI